MKRDKVGETSCFTVLSHFKAIGWQRWEAAEEEDGDFLPQFEEGSHRNSPDTILCACVRRCNVVFEGRRCQILG